MTARCTTEIARTPEAHRGEFTKRTKRKLSAILSVDVNVYRIARMEVLYAAL